MTENEAIEQLKQEIGARIWYKILDSKEIAKIQERDFHKFVEACKLSISTLEEIQKYRELGTVEELREAMEKQEPKKPTIVYFDGEHNYCPNCGNIIDNTYCSISFGQKIDLE